MFRRYIHLYFRICVTIKYKYSFNIKGGVHFLSTADLNYETYRGYDVIPKILSKISRVVIGTQGILLNELS